MHNRKITVVQHIPSIACLVTRQLVSQIVSRTVFMRRSSVTLHLEVQHLSGLEPQLTGDGDVANGSCVKYMFMYEAKKLISKLKLTQGRNFPLEESVNTFLVHGERRLIDADKRLVAVVLSCPYIFVVHQVSNIVVQI